jgi:hypothetical protein
MSSRTIALALSAALLAGVALAEGGKAPARPEVTKHEMTVQVVSVDAKARTITFKDDQGQTKTAPAIGRAIRQIRIVRTGETYTLICEDNAKGDHLGINGIRTAKLVGKPAGVPPAPK